MISKTVTIRKARPEDAAVISRVHIDSWRSTYQGVISDDVLDGLSYERGEQRWDQILNAPEEHSIILVALTGDEIIGFASAGPERDSNSEFSGETYAIYLLPPYQRMGLGRQLMQAVAERLLEAGMMSMLVWVLKENTGSRRFYETIGGNLIDEKSIEIGDQSYPAVSYGWDDIRILISREE